MLIRLMKSNAAPIFGLTLLPLIGLLTGCEMTGTRLHRLSRTVATDTDESWDEEASTSYYAADSGTSGEENANSLAASIAPARHSAEGAEANQSSQSSRSKRQMVYTGQFTVATATVNETIDLFIKGTEGIGGYLESRNDNHVVVRVPADSFDSVVNNMPSLGDVLRRSIKNDDVTRQHRDLKLRIEGLAASRQRILELLKRADKIEDIVKLEERLAELTLQLEMAQGEFKTLGEQIAYSRVEVEFQTKSLEAVSQRTNRFSPFAWINQLGAQELALGEMQGDPEYDATRRNWKTMWPGAIEETVPEGFLVVKRTRKDVQAITADDARLRIRKLNVPKKGTLDFWSKALVNHLVDNRGYELVQERGVRDGRGRQGRELTFDVVTRGTATRYLTTLVLEQRPFWSRNNAIEVTEFVAPQDEFEPYVKAFHQSRKWRVIDEHPQQIEPHYAGRNTSGEDDLVRGQSTRQIPERHFFDPPNAR